MKQAPKPPITVDAFLAWAEGEEGRYELYHGPSGLQFLLRRTMA